MHQAPVLSFWEGPKNTVTDVAYQLNFSSSNHFSSVFRKYTGCTPTYFRRHRFSNIY
ncbi:MULTISPECIES: AraC family transcriptional regulator [Clostridia]|uniref:AraC family transcriptional regulator n=1 Tax=Clostridia TaxID=186801 RepID=UPI0009E65346